MQKPDATPTKRCPICSLDLPIGEFGICRARKDGRNLYCKSCIRAKVTTSRIALKEYKAARKRIVQKQIELQPEASTLTFKLAPVDRVRIAIQKGARTQREIAHETGLGKDEIGDALANLLLWTHEIKTRVIEGVRMYFMNEVEEKPVVHASTVSLFDIARKSLGPVVKGDRKIKRVA